MKQFTLALGAIAAALLGVIAVQRSALRTAALQRDSLEVAADSSRRHWDGELQIAARRAFQAEVQLAHALQQGRATGATLVQLRLEADSLRRITAGQVTHHPTDSTFTASGELAAESLGVTVRADVLLRGLSAVPGATVTSAFQWDVIRHPVLLDVALVCLPGHRAEARVSSPSAVLLTVQGAASRPDVCYPPPRWSPLSLRPPSLPWVAGAFVAGVLVAR